MKKSQKLIFITLLSFVLFMISLSGCTQENPLFNNLSELKSNVFYGKSENFSVKASYGFKEEPFVNDGKVGKLNYQLTFNLIDKPADQTTYSVSITFNEKNYSATFKNNPITNNLKAVILVDDFDLNNFNAKISFGSSEETISLTSLVPENTLTPTVALQKLLEEQTALIESFYDSEGNFNAEIYMRILIKDDKPYYYIGFASGKEKLKALLVDGITGKTLAIREIF